MKKLLFYASAVAVLFSSCSKDATEDVAINNVGNKVFSASIAVEDDGQQKTRMSITENEDREVVYVWNINDAVGVGSKSQPAANILVNNTVEGETPSFAVGQEDLERWLGISENTDDANPMYVYFPYMPGTAFTDKGEIELTIPKEQRYANDSFYRNTVPAVGYVEEYTGADQKIPLYVPVSMLRVEVCGFGDAKSISLKIETPASVKANQDTHNFYQLAGKALVNIVPEKDKEYRPAFTFGNATTESIDPSVESSSDDMITVTFGQLPEELKYDETAAFPVHFVIPAGLDLSEAKLHFQIDGDGDTFVYKMPQRNPNNPEALMTKPNGRLKMTSAPVVFNMKDKLVMSDPEQFLVWAFLNSSWKKTVNKTTNYEYTINDALIDAQAVFNLGQDASLDQLTPLVINDLDFANYGKTWADAELARYDKMDFADSEVILWHEVLTWYKNNNYQIETLQKTTKPALYGHSGETPVAIKNLNVLGEGITKNVSLKNLKFENVTVNAALPETTDGKTTYTQKAKAVGFIAATNTSAASIENVVIGEGNVVNAYEATGNVGGIYGSVAKDMNLLEEAAAITINVAAKSDDYDGPAAIGALYGTLSSALEIETAGYELSASQDKLPLIGVATGANANITATGALSETAINAGIVGKVEGTSYVLVDDVFYWNGVYEFPNDGKAPYTAEELAYDLYFAGVDNIVLTNDIDMQSSHKFALQFRHDNTGTGYNSVNSTEAEGSTKENPVYNQFEIKNFDISPLIDNTPVALFGNANVANVKLSNIVLNTNRGDKVAGVAVTGSATNVDVDGLTINIDKNVTEIKSIGGVLAEATDADIDDVNVKSISIVYGGTKVLGARAGLIAGTLNIKPNSETKLKSFNCGAKTLNTFTNLVSNQKDKADKNGSWYPVYKDTNNYADALPFGTICVANAAVNKNGNTKAYLKLTDANFGTMTRLAAGVVFSFSDPDWVLLKEKTEVGHDATAVDTYKYVLVSEGKIGSGSNTVFGFTAK